MTSPSSMHEAGQPKPVHWDSPEGWDRGNGGSGLGTHVHMWLIHVHVWQKPSQYCKVASFQLKKKKKNTGVGSHCLLQGIFLTQESNPGLPHFRQILYHWGFPGGPAGEESACNAGDLGSISGLGRSPGEAKGYLLQYSGLENSRDEIKWNKE